MIKTSKCGNFVKKVDKTPRRFYRFNITLLPLVGFLLLSINISFAAPINNLEQGETTMGVVGSNYYVENKLNDNFTTGIQYFDWNKSRMTDLYGQFNIKDSNLRVIIGNRNFDDNSSQRTYVGAAISSQSSSDWLGYTSIIAGNGFQELQLGTTYKINENYGLIFDLHSLRYEGTNNDINIGLMFNF